MTRVIIYGTSTADFLGKTFFKVSKITSAR